MAAVAMAWARRIVLVDVPVRAAPPLQVGHAGTVFARDLGACLQQPDACSNQMQRAETLENLKLM